jgi:heat shock protein HslJ
MRLTTACAMLILVAAPIVAGCSTSASTSNGSSAQASAGPTVAASGAPSTAAGPSAPASLTPGASPPATLLGTTWKLTQIRETTPPFQASVPEADRSKYTIEFHPDGTFTLTADCNQVSGGYAVYRGDGQNNLPLEESGGDMKFLPGPSTAVACASGSLSDLLISALRDTSGFNIDSDLLTITLTDDSKLQFSR